MSIFTPPTGTWDVSSNDDPRWTKSGSGEPYHISKWIEECKESLGPIPMDIQTSFRQE